MTHAKALCIFLLLVLLGCGESEREKLQKRVEADRPKQEQWEKDRARIKEDFQNRYDAFVFSASKYKDKRLFTYHLTEDLPIKSHPILFEGWLYDVTSGGNDLIFHFVSADELAFYSSRRFYFHLRSSDPNLRILVAEPLRPLDLRWVSAWHAEFCVVFLLDSIHQAKHLFVTCDVDEGKKGPRTNLYYDFPLAFELTGKLLAIQKYPGAR